MTPFFSLLRSHFKEAFSPTGISTGPCGQPGILSGLIEICQGNQWMASKEQKGKLPVTKHYRHFVTHDGRVFCESWEDKIKITHVYSEKEDHMTPLISELQYTSLDLALVSDCYLTQEISSAWPLWLDKIFKIKLHAMSCLLPKGKRTVPLQIR